MRDQFVYIILAGRDTTACLLLWTLLVKSYIHVARPASEPLLQRIAHIKHMSLASDSFTQTLPRRSDTDDGAIRPHPGSLKA